MQAHSKTMAMVNVIWTSSSKCVILRPSCFATSRCSLLPSDGRSGGISWTLAVWKLYEEKNYIRSKAPLCLICPTSRESWLLELGLLEHLSIEQPNLCVFQSTLCRRLCQLIKKRKNCPLRIRTTAENRSWPTGIDMHWKGLSLKNVRLRYHI